MLMMRPAALQITAVLALTVLPPVSFIAPVREQVMIFNFLQTCAGHLMQHRNAQLLVLSPKAWTGNSTNEDGISVASERKDHTLHFEV